MTKEKAARILEHLAVIVDCSDALKHSNYIRAREIRIAAEEMINLIKSEKVGEDG